MPPQAVQNIPITRVADGISTTVNDAIAIEEPLEIRLEHGPADSRTVQNISVTMRTPGNDSELAIGFLFTEGVITSANEVGESSHQFIACAENKENVIVVSLAEGAVPRLQNTERNFYTTSSCGVCGKGSINAIRTVSNYSNGDDSGVTINTETLIKLPDTLRRMQQVFEATGGLHGCALFTTDGKLLLLREDVGRHNALDKLIGAALNQNILPLNNHVLLLSGRASFELVQKAAMAGISIIAAVGAPSSLAVQLAREFNITLVGFLRGERFNIYNAPQRIQIPVYEDSYQK
ncbi:formate dehydrogenase accessory sulfurtransferase FdhD [Mucilaginibacter sp.]|uniref:formate dehydrogenase accessory sulfurtransferase FdhD n=1 Tax=Mucilaginibacter sp. TaxID=1882438 RepID=UPI0035BBD4AF